MKITLNSTEDIRTVGGMQMRLWEGQSDDGTECWALIPVIATRNSEQQTVFDRELEETSVGVPQEGTAIFPLRMVLP